MTDMTELTRRLAIIARQGIDPGSAIAGAVADGWITARQGRELEEKS